MFKCFKCKKQQSTEEFYPGHLSRRYYLCKTCSRKKARDWRSKKYRTDAKFRLKVKTQKKQYDERHPTRKTDERLKKAYGISYDEYSELSNKQDGCCAICKQPEKVKRKGRLKKACGRSRSRYRAGARITL
jgi:hypothetical protein